MNQETYTCIERFMQTHQLTSNEIAVYDVQNGNHWTLRANPQYMLRALDLLLTAEHAIVSHIALDQSATRYLVTLPCTIGAVRSGIYTYNPDKDMLE
jgi:hypothetical protein